MAGKCKACYSVYRDEIDNRLRRGEACTTVANWLHDLGHNISHTSIKRHRDSHVEHLVIYEKKPVDKIKPVSVDTDFFKNINAKVKSLNPFASAVVNSKKIQVWLELIVENQLVNVYESQVLFMAGNGCSPDAQIKSLKTIVDMINTLSAYKDLRKELKADTLDNLRMELSDYVYNASKNPSSFELPSDLIKQIVLFGLSVDDRTKPDKINNAIDHLENTVRMTLNKYQNSNIGKIEILLSEPETDKGVSQETINRIRRDVLGMSE